MSNLTTLYISRFEGINCRDFAPVVRAENVEPTEWVNTPVSVALPTGWHLAECTSGSQELYDATGNHRSLILSGDTIEAINEHGIKHLPIIA